MVHPTLYLDDSSMGISSIDRRLPSGLGLRSDIKYIRPQESDLMRIAAWLKTGDKDLRCLLWSSPRAHSIAFPN